MSNAHDIVQHFFSALYRGDARTARRYLADDLSFVGPGARFSNADQYLRATEHVARAARQVEQRKVFADGSDVCIFYDLHIDHAVDCVPIAEWYHVEGERIASIRTILDTAPFTSPAPANSATAVDPVCGMTVAIAQAPATRTYAGQTYVFCNPGCAEAFDAQPERYVVAA